MVHRVAIDLRELVRVLGELHHQLGARTAQHGPLGFIGPHEALGILDEEFDEFRDAVRANDSEAVRRELMDIAVAAVWGIVSRDAVELLDADARNPES